MFDYDPDTAKAQVSATVTSISFGIDRSYLGGATTIGAFAQTQATEQSADPSDNAPDGGEVTYVVAPLTLSLVLAKSSPAQTAREFFIGLVARRSDTAEFVQGGAQLSCSASRGSPSVPLRA